MDNVVSLSGGNAKSDRREALLSAVARSFDNYVGAAGHEPDALVWAFGGTHQPCITGWLIQGASEGAATSVLALSALALQHEATRAYD